MRKNSPTDKQVSVHSIRCRGCGRHRPEQFFSPQERIGDGESHLCWDCERLESFSK